MEDFTKQDIEDLKNIGVHIIDGIKQDVQKLDKKIIRLENDSKQLRVEDEKLQKIKAIINGGQQ